MPEAVFGLASVKGACRAETEATLEKMGDFDRRIAPYVSALASLEAGDLTAMEIMPVIRDVLSGLQTEKMNQDGLRARCARLGVIAAECEAQEASGDGGQPGYVWLAEDAREMLAKEASALDESAFRATFDALPDDVQEDVGSWEALRDRDWAREEELPIIGLAA